MMVHDNNPIVCPHHRPAEPQPPRGHAAMASHYDLIDSPGNKSTDESQDRFPPSPIGRFETHSSASSDNKPILRRSSVSTTPYACMARGLHRPPVAALDDLSLRGRRLRLQHTVRPHFSPFAPDAPVVALLNPHVAYHRGLFKRNNSAHESHDDMLPPGWVVVLSL